MCQREGLHQIDLLAPAKEKTSEKEYRARTRGQKKLEQVNQKIMRGRHETDGKHFPDAEGFYQKCGL